MQEFVSLPLAGERSFDVVVIGGGVTGVCAAVAAARSGAAVGLIEKNAFLGGVAAMGLPWLGFHNADFHRVIGGIPYEILHRMQKQGDASSFFYDPICNSAVMVDSVALRMALQAAATDAGVHTVYHCLALPGAVEDNHLRSVLLSCKQGLIRWNARTFVDATDGGDIAIGAGADWIFGREEDGRSQVSSVVLTVGNLDIDEMLAYFADHPDQIRPFAMQPSTAQKLLAQMRTAPGFILGAFPKLVAQARAAGAEYYRDFVIGAVYRAKRQMTLVTGRVEQAEPGDLERISQAESLATSQIEGTLRMLRAFIPGFQTCFAVSVGHQLGIRETRHVRGAYVLQAEDLLKAAPFEDPVALGAYHLDVHSPDHGGLDTHKPPTYSIPYRCLLPNAPENVFLAGRAISATHEAQSSTRVIPISGAIGQAAGCAAALCARENLPGKRLPYETLREALTAQGTLLAARLEEDE